MDIASGITAVTQAINIARALRSVERDFDAATYKAQMADLINALTDAKLALSEAKDGVAERDKEITRLKANFEMKSALVRGVGDYDYLADANGNPLGYPVCPRCEQVDGRIIQLKEHENSGKARCPACSDVYTPVVSYLPHGSAHLTKQDQELADWEAAAAASSRHDSYFP